MLFCSEICSEFARAVRYHRRVLADGRIGQPDVQAAVSVRMAYALWGEAPAKPLMAMTRAALFAAKGDRCLSCRAPATDVDHVVSAASGDNSLANLQPLCHSCHLEKTLSSPVPWDTSSGDAIARHERREATYWARVRAQPSLRVCDDERTWPFGWRTALSTRVAARATGQLDTELRALLELIAGRLTAGRSLDLAAADSENALGLSRKRRRALLTRLRMLVPEPPA